MKFRKKPVVVEAEQYLPDAPAKLPDGICTDTDDNVRGHHHAHTGAAHIHTLEGDMLVSPSDWVITGVKGERYPCKPDIFAATYEPA